MLVKHSISPCLTCYDSIWCCTFLLRTLCESWNGLKAADPYLVVAADRGTAALSDTANEIAASYGFWLRDAFASGGSEGYDHKALGITARGAWESVKRHFADMSIDAQTHPISVVGIGDMSGDVFGNGMLQSPHFRVSRTVRRSSWRTRRW